MRVLFFGTYEADRHPRIQVLQEGLREAGDTVVECNFPLHLDTAHRLRLLQRPWLIPRLMGRLTRNWVALRNKSRALGPVDAVVVGYMGHLDVHLARRLWPNIPLVLDHLVPVEEAARDRRISSQILLKTLTEVDKRAVMAADVTIVDTREHLQLLDRAYRDRAIVIPVGASSTWFRPPVPSHHQSLRVVFFGLYTPLQGTPVIGQAANRLRGEPVEFTMIGTGQDFAETRLLAGGNPAVRWLDWVNPGDLPAMVSEHDVCLGIFGTTDKAKRVIPNKVFQGAAAGCMVITSDTPPQRRILGKAGRLIAPGDAQSLASALKELNRNPKSLWQSRQSIYKLAEEFRPPTVVEPLRRRLLELVFQAG